MQKLYALANELWERTRVTFIQFAISHSWSSANNKLDFRNWFGMYRIFGLWGRTGLKFANIPIDWWMVYREINGDSGLKFFDIWLTISIPSVEFEWALFHRPSWHIWWIVKHVIGSNKMFSLKEYTEFNRMLFYHTMSKHSVIRNENQLC